MKPRSLLLTLPLLACTVAPLYAKDPSSLVPVVVSMADNKDGEMFTRQMRINDFSLERYRDWDCDSALTGCTAYTRILPYFLKAGTNAVAMDYWANTLDSDPTRQYEVAFHLREVELLGDPAVNNKLTIGKELVEIRTPKYPKISEDEKRHLDTTFEWKHPLPVWSWTRGVPIEQTEENKQSLHAEYKRIWKALQNPAQLAKLEKELRTSTKEYLEACRIGKQTDGLATMIALAKNPRRKNVPLVLRDVPDADELTMQLFAGGRLAKLVNYYAVMIRFVGGAHDAPRGQPGPVDIGYDLWFRKNAKGQWEVDAVAPAADLNE